MIFERWKEINQCKAHRNESSRIEECFVGEGCLVETKSCIERNAGHACADPKKVIKFFKEEMEKLKLEDEEMNFLNGILILMFLVMCISKCFRETNGVEHQIDKKNLKTSEEIETLL